MITSLAKTLYPECGYRPDGTLRAYFDSPDDYTPIIQSFGHVIVRIDEDGYEGDTFVLLGKDDRYGFLVFGWGSCSGCDALQGCNSYDDIDALIAELENDINWFDTFEAAKDYINDDLVRRGSYYYHAKNWAEFKSAVNAFAAPTP